MGNRAQRKVDLRERAFDRDAFAGEPVQRGQQRKTTYQGNRGRHRAIRPSNLGCITHRYFGVKCLADNPTYA